MNTFCKSDPYGNRRDPAGAAKLAKVAQLDGDNRASAPTLASLATLAAPPKNWTTPPSAPTFLEVALVSITTTAGVTVYFADNPMNQDILSRLARLRAATRCGAKTRAGTACQCPAIRNRARCRLHGGLSTGAPHGKRNGNYRDGTFTADAVAERRWAKSLVRSLTKPRQS